MDRTCYADRGEKTDPAAKLLQSSSCLHRSPFIWVLLDTRLHTPRQKVTIRRKREWYGKKGEVSTAVTLLQMTNFHDADAQTVFCSVRDPGFRDLAK